MHNTKYLSDGRKVVVLGKLNSTEYIVQEIFVTQQGQEIPSGDNFTAKNLHDAPVESFHSRELAKQQSRIENLQEQLKNINSRIKDAQDELSAKKDMLANSPELQSIAGEKSRILAMFMTGTVKYLVFAGYHLRPPVAMSDHIKFNELSYGRTRYHSLKLCSVLGNSNGDIEYRIHQYLDGSGSSEEVYPFENFEEAVEKIRCLASEKIEKNHLSIDEFNMCVSLGIKFSREQKEMIYATHSEKLKQQIKEIEDTIAKGQSNLVDIQKRLATLEENILADHK